MILFCINQDSFDQSESCICQGELIYTGNPAAFLTCPAVSASNFLRPVSLVIFFNCVGFYSFYLRMGTLFSRNVVEERKLKHNETDPVVATYLHL